MKTEEKSGIAVVFAIKTKFKANVKEQKLEKIQAKRKFERKTGHEFLLACYGTIDKLQDLLAVLAYFVRFSFFFFNAIANSRTRNHLG